MDSPFWDNAIAVQFRHVAGSIGSLVPAYGYSWVGRIAQNGNA